LTKLILTREDIERNEEQILAPYAALSSKSRGRAYPQSEHPLRTCFQRDRDRIVHSAAFRRMEYKTQVFIPHEQDHFRTRLTHTIEVAQISRTVARSLGLNEDLAESIALVHDLGHTPFGHAGEDVLDEILKESGGFNHNRQSLRVVDILERRYPEHPGLNLSYEVREGIVKHETKITINSPEFDINEGPTLEAALVDKADEIAYNAHDIDDGLSSGLITLEDISRSNFADIFELELGEAKTMAPDKIRYAIVRRLIDRTVNDLLHETSRRIKENNTGTIDSVRGAKTGLCSHTKDMQAKVKLIKDFLFNRLYQHPDLKKHSTRAGQVISGIFESLTKNPKLLPLNYQSMLESEKLETVAADYIAGMTDRFAGQKFIQLQQ
jgi:dGTPase